MMIDTRELRIGNLLSLEGEIWIVTSIPDDSNYYNDFNPIPLTNDWFDKFDWQDGFSKGKLSRSGLSVRLLGHDMDVKYVHNLQNLYYEVEKEELKHKTDDKGE